MEQMDLKAISAFLEKNKEDEGVQELTKKWGEHAWQSVNDKLRTQVQEQTERIETLQAEVGTARGDTTGQVQELEKIGRDLQRREDMVKLRERAIEMGIERDLPASLAVRFVGQDDEGTESGLEELLAHIKTIADRDVNKRLVGDGQGPGGGEPSGLSLDALRHMSAEEIGRIPTALIDKAMREGN